MIRYIAWRVLGIIPVVMLISAFTFLSMHLIPGSPAVVMLGEMATADQVRALEEKMGLDKPLVTQYAIWLGGLLSGNFGDSVLYRIPVARLVSRAIGPSMILATCGLIVALLIGIPVGILSAVRRGGWLDQMTRVLAMFGASVPSFWLGLNLIILFAVMWRMLPTSGYEAITRGGISALRYLVLPALALGLPSGAAIARITRSCMLDVLQEDFVRTGRSKGQREIVIILRHALRVASPTLLTVVSYTFLDMMSRAVVIETVFRVPGLGQLAMTAIMNRDYPIVQGVILLVSSTYIIANLLTDLSYGLLDPRISYKDGER